MKFHVRGNKLLVKDIGVQDSKVNYGLRFLTKLKRTVEGLIL